MYYEDEYLQIGSNYVEPILKCPKCGNGAHADWVSVLSAPYEVQVSPFHCYSCGWTEQGCVECIGEKCKSFPVCKGDALIPSEELD